MTRTERAGFPRALMRDRSESKSGLDKSVRKNGGGQHNWGSIHDEAYLEAAAYQDEEEDLTTEQQHFSSIAKKPIPEKHTSSSSEEERQSARQFRKHALKSQDIDLSTIARTSAAVSISPPNRSPPITITDSAETASIKSNKTQNTAAMLL